MRSAPNTMSGRRRRTCAQKRTASRRRCRRFMRLSIEVVAGLQREVQMRHQPLLLGRAPAAGRRPPRWNRWRRAGSRRNSGTCFRSARTSVPRRGAPGRSAPQEVRSTPVSTTSPKPCSTMVRTRSDHRAHRHRARVAAAIGDDAEGAAVVAAILHLHEGAGVPVYGVGRPVDEVRRGLAHRHDVADEDLLLGLNAEVERRMVECLPRRRPARGRQLLLIAEHAVDLGHAGEAGRLGLRGAAGDDDAALRVLALQPADRLARLLHRLAGDGAGVDDDGALQARRRRPSPWRWRNRARSAGSRRSRPRRTWDASSLRRHRSRPVHRAWRR